MRATAPGCNHKISDEILTATTVETQIGTLKVFDGMPTIETTPKAAEGTTLAVAAAKSPVRSMLDRAGLTRRIGPDRMFPTVESAVEALSHDISLLPKEIGR